MKSLNAAARSHLVMPARRPRWCVMWGNAVLQRVARHVTRSWQDYSHLFLVGDSAGWVIDWERRELTGTAHRIGVRVANARWLSCAQHQAVFYGSHFFLLDGAWLGLPHRIGTAYFHGRPGSGVAEFDHAYAKLCQHHDHLARLQVSHSEMRDVVLSSGIAPEKVFLIPIGVNLAYFRVQSPQSKRAARDRLGIPASAVVIGSFQKDGAGWGEGLQPKLIKGPDIFLAMIAALRPSIPELFVLLSGPARGYVKAGLESLGVPYHHVYVRNYPQIGELYQALDAYVVTSRQEGGPKAILEAMGSGIPLVTTRVGQAMDLVRHGENGWMVEVEDVGGLAHWTEQALSDRNKLAEVVQRGRQTAEANTYEAQTPRWRALMEGFVDLR